MMAEEAASKDATAAPERGGDRPRARTRRHERPYNPRRLKWGASSSCRSKDRASLLYCQASGREIRIIHHREGQYHLNGYQDDLKGIAEKTLLSLSVVESTIEKYLEEEEAVSRIVTIVKYITRYMRMIEKENGKIDHNVQAVDVLRYIMTLPHAKKSQMYDALVAVHDIIEAVSTVEAIKIKIKENVKVTLPEYLSMILEK